MLFRSEDASNVFTNEPIGLDFVNAAVHVRPEVAVIFRASSLPGATKRLARKAASEDIDPASPFSKIGFCDVFITLVVWKPIIEHFAPKWVNLAME